MKTEIKFGLLVLMILAAAARAGEDGNHHSDNSLTFLKRE
jgi:hypothetical protein